MKVLVAYFSETGNTERIAKAIYAAAENEDRKLVPIDEAENLQDFDVIFVGFPIIHHSVPGKAARLISLIPASKPVAIFSTHGALRGGKLAVEGFYHAVSLASRLHVLGTFGAQGKVDLHALDKLAHLPEYRGWLEEARAAASHPDTGDMEDARSFAATMLALAVQYKKSQR